MPGLSVTRVILLLPLTYCFHRPHAIISSGCLCRSMYGGSISAITLNTPGTNSAIATTLTDTRWRKRGKPWILRLSTFGGLFPPCFFWSSSFITKLVSKFASVEYFSMAILGISR
ncbi:MAG: tripartite tricarboxylate transporter permease [Eisenbergiella sp.]